MAAGEWLESSGCRNEGSCSRGHHRGPSVHAGTHLANRNESGPRRGLLQSRSCLREFCPDGSSRDSEHWRSDEKSCCAAVLHAFGAQTSERLFCGASFVLVHRDSQGAPRGTSVGREPGARAVRDDRGLPEGLHRRCKCFARHADRGAAGWLRLLEAWTRRTAARCTHGDESSRGCEDRIAERPASSPGSTADRGELPGCGLLDPRTGTRSEHLHFAVAPHLLGGGKDSRGNHPGQAGGSGAESSQCE